MQASIAKNSVDLNKPLDPLLLEKVSELLLAADTSYLKVRTKDRQQFPSGTVVEAQLAAQHPGIFDVVQRRPGDAPQIATGGPASADFLSPPLQTKCFKSTPAGSSVPRPSTRPTTHEVTVPNTVQPSSRKKRTTPKNLDLQPTEQSVEELTDDFMGVLEGLLCLDEAGEECLAEFLSLKQLRQLSEQVFKMKSNGVLQRVPANRLAQLLSQLKKQLQFGHERTLQDEDTESSDSFLSLMESLEACICSLYILSSPGMPREVYREDLIQELLEFLKFNLQSNVYVFHDLHCRQLYRPSSTLSDDEADTVETPRHRGRPKRQGSTKKSARKVTPRVPKTVVELLRRLCNAVQLVGQVLDNVQLEGSCLLPFLRVLFQGLGITGLDLLHSKVTVVVVRCFQLCVNLRQSVFEEFLSAVLLQASSSKYPVKAFLTGEDAQATLQITTALLLKMVQVSVELPSLDTNPADLAQTYRQAYYWSDVFWSHLCERIPAGRVAKADAELDVKAVMEQILTDILAVHTFPDWPAASTLLLCCMSTLCSTKGLQHPEHPPRQIATDLLGTILARLWKEGKAAEADVEWMKEQLVAFGYLDPGTDKSTDVAATANKLLIDFLVASAHAGATDEYSSALTHVLCRSLSEEVAAAQKSHVPNEQLTLILVNHRQVLESEGNPQLKGLSRADVLRINRIVVHGGRIGRARSSKLKSLLEAADLTKQNATTRAKAIKAVGLVVESDTRCLGLPDVQNGVNKALQDEAISVREAAVELLGRHISTQEELALAYFDTLGRASADPGTSVRKRALKILWECCIKQPSFPRCTEACVHVLMRATDNEESIQKLVKEVFHNLWFSSEDGNRTLALRAEQLAQVAASVYEAASKNIHVPLDLNHKLVVVLRSALALDDKDGRSSTEAGRDIAGALLEKLLTVGEKGDSELQEFNYLLALHALCVTEPTLCVPREDPERFIRALAPYIKVSPRDADKQQTETQKRRGAEHLLCIVSILDALFGQLGRPNSTPVNELINDLVMLICHHLYVQVVAAACRCLCTLAAADEQAAAMLVKRFQVCSQTLTHVLANDVSSKSAQDLQSARAHAARYLFVMGQLCRYGANIVESERCSSVEHPTMTDCLHQCLAFLTHDTFMKVQESALQAMGLLFIARPHFMLLPKSREVVKSTLTVDAPLAFKTRAISNLLELLKAESERMVSKQQEAADASRSGVTIPGLTKTASVKYIPKQNGEGDTLSLSSSILQDNWDCVLSLAVDTSRPGGQHEQQSSPSHPTNALVRSRTLELMEAVLRDGLVAPWTAIPCLMALVTDPNEECATKALRLLKMEAEKHATLFDGRLAQGVSEAYMFQSNLAKEFGLNAGHKSVISPDVIRGMCSLYVNIIQPNKSMRNNFLQMLIKPFDAGSCLTTKGAAKADIRFLYFCAQLVAGLPLKRGDECYLLVHHINATLSRRAELVYAAFKASITGKVSVTPSPCPPATATEPQPVPSSAPAGNPAPHTTAAGGHASTPSRAIKTSSDVKLECKASLAICMLLLLKRYLIQAYGMTSDRILAFTPIGEVRKQEERTPVTKQNVPHRMENLKLHAPDDPELMREQYKVIKSLMSEDSTDYADSYITTTTKKKAGSKATAGQANNRAQENMPQPASMPTGVTAVHDEGGRLSDARHAVTHTAKKRKVLAANDALDGDDMFAVRRVKFSH